MSERVKATIENMQEHYHHGVFAYSVTTGEEHSANPADYFWAPKGFAVKGDDGNDMYLARRETRIIYVESAA